MFSFVTLSSLLSNSDIPNQSTFSFYLAVTNMVLLFGLAAYCAIGQLLPVDNRRRSHGSTTPHPNALIVVASVLLPPICRHDHGQAVALLLSYVSMQRCSLLLCRILY